MTVAQLAALLGGPRVSISVDEVVRLVGAQGPPRSVLATRLATMGALEPGEQAPGSRRDTARDALLSSFSVTDLQSLLARTGTLADAPAFSFARPAFDIVDDLLGIMEQTPSLFPPFAKAVSAARPGRPDVRAAMQELHDFGFPPSRPSAQTPRAPSSDPAFTASVAKSLASAFDESGLRDVLARVPGELRHHIYWQQPVRAVVNDMLAVLRDRDDAIVPFADAVIAARPGRPDVQAVAREMRTRGTV
jgi:hypothetical protein